MRNYLDYYKKFNIIPVVNTGDLDEKTLFQQRFNFYFKIGITPIEFKNKSVLELCAGTGYNAYYLLKHCKIKDITLVDNNPKSLQFLRKNLSKFENKKIINKDINFFSSKKKFDYVIIENALQGLNNPEKILRKMIKFTKSGGCLVLTLANLEGLLSDKLRYLYSILLVNQKNILDDDLKLKFLTNLFQKHLRYLSPNTRKADKWVVDNILHTSWITKKKYFDLLDVKKILKKKNYIKSTSPAFSKDFIWYKNMTLNNYNNNIISNYLKERVNFIDFETQFSINTENRKFIYQLYNLIKKLNLKTSKIGFNKKLKNGQIDEIYNIISKISKILNFLKNKNKITLALNEFLKIILSYKKKKLNTKTKYFHKLWSIGTNSINLYKI
tara:strand:+ start:855 stop:2006 length:1152 start_codon:yes stop_codon:yes gene_type:complete